MKHTLLTLLFGACLALNTPIFAGPDYASKNPKAPMIAPAPPEDEWWFRVAPYAWAPGLEGDIAIGSLAAEVDLSPSDVIENTDIAAMLFLEAGKGRWGLGVDIIYSQLSGSVSINGPLAKSAGFEFEQWVITPRVSYRVIDRDDYMMNAFVGARYVHIDTDLNVKTRGGANLHAGDNQDWVDPILGVNGRWMFSSHWFFNYYGDIGGFGANSDLTWQALAGFGYSFTESFAIGVGYRALGFDGEYDKFEQDVVNHGPYLGFEVRF